MGQTLTSSDPVGIDRNGLLVEIATERKYRIQMRKTRGMSSSALQARTDDIEAYTVEL